MWNSGVKPLRRAEATQTIVCFYSELAVTERASNWNLLLEIAEPTPFLALRVRLVSRMKGVVEIDAGQDRKYVGLQERDQQLKCSQGNGQCQRHHATDPANR